MKLYCTLLLLSYCSCPASLEADLPPASWQIPEGNGSVPERWSALEKPATGQAAGTVAEAWSLRRRQRVAYGLPLPSDTFFAAESFNPQSIYQWPCIGHPNATWPHIQINLLEAWTRSTGAGIRIGIVDDGVALDHPDLAADTALDHDWNDATPDDASPVIPANHGTACAGLATARRNNRFAIAGVAPDAIPVGLRLIAGEVTDAQEAEAMAWRNDVIHIKSNSWGPLDPSFPASLDGPGPLTLAAIEDAVTNGRGGKGTVFVWAAGNGGAGDCANYNGYANSIRGIAVSSSNLSDYPANSAESGSNILLCVPVEGASYPATGLPLLGAASASLWGSSGACPIVAGTVALMLERNPALGYRDVQEILIRSARRVETWVPPWPANGAGLRFQSSFGAGMLDALASVELAGRWENLPPETTVSLSSGSAPLPIPDYHPAGAVRTFDFSTLPALRVEHVQVTVNATHARRGQLVWELTSPSGMVSLLADKRPGDAESDLTNWTFSSVCHWGEPSTGVWTVKARDNMNQPEFPAGTLGGVTVRLQGTPLTAPAAAPVLEGPFAAEARMEEAFCYFIKGSHRPASYAGTGLPPGFSVDATTGQIKGRPTATGTWTVNLSATNSMGTGAGTLTLTVLPRQLRPPVVTSTASARGIRTSPFFYRLTSAAATSVSVASLPAGLTFSSTTRLITGTPTAAGTFTATLSATNADGTVTAPLEIVVDEPASTPLVTALDLPGAAWTTTGIGGWYPTTALTHDGADAAAIRLEETNNYAGMTTTVQGPGELAFWYYWLRPGESGDGTFSVQLDGIEQPFGWIAANTWHQRRLLLTPGPHVVEFRVTRYNESAPPSTWLVDELQFLPAVPIGEAVEQPAATFTSDGTWQGQTAENFDGQDAAAVLARGLSSTSWLQTTLSGPGELFFRWRSSTSSGGMALRLNGVVVENVANNDAWAAASQLLTAGTHTVRWQLTEPAFLAPAMPLGWLDQVQVLPVLTLAEGLDTPDRVWNTSGVAGWVAQRAENEDGSDAARSPQVTAPQTSSLTTQVTGPAEVQFSWKGNYLSTARVDGAVQRTHPTNVWVREPLLVAAGTHTVEFREEGSRMLVDHFEVIPAVTMTDALDTVFTVTPAAANGWYPQTMVAHDAADAATASAAPPGQRSEMSAAMTGAGLLRFWWRYDERGLLADQLQLIVDGSLAITLTATTAWREETIVLASGAHTITWSLLRGTDTFATIESRAWVDELSFTPFPPLADGVDTPGRVWTDAGNAGFYTQTAISHDGTDAVQAGSVPVNQTAGLASEFTGPGVLTFWWKVNSGFGNTFSMALDGYEQTAISAVADWNQRSVVVGPGTHSAAWRFFRAGASNVAGGDSAWLDEVAFTPGAVLTVAEAVDLPAQPFGFTGGQWAGQTAETFDGVDAAASPPAPVASTMFTTFQGPGVLRWRWRTDGTANQSSLYLNGALSYLNATSAWQESTLELDSGPQTAGWRLNSNEPGKRLWVDAMSYAADPGISLPGALDTAGITWTTSGEAPWFGQSVTAWDGSDAAKSPRLFGSGGVADLTGTVTGPALLTFRWKNSFQSAADSLSFSVDGTLRETISGTQDWAARTFVIDPGSHALRWRVTRSSVLGFWAGRAWVDTVALEPLPLPGFGDGLDQPLLTWTLAGTQQWFAQSAEGCDGTDVVTTPTLAVGDTADFFTSVSGPAMVSFYAKMSDASASRRLTVTVDGVTAFYLPSEFEWMPLRLLVPSGTHVLRWSLTRPVNVGADNPPGRAWVDRLVLAPATAPSLGDALNAPQLAWSSTGAGWFPQTHYSVDGVAAGAVVTAGQQADLLTTVTGPGVLNFTLPGVSTAAPAAVTFRVNGASAPAVTAPSRALYLPPGAQALDWRVTGLSGTRREVAVDQVSFTPFGTTTFALAADLAGTWSATAGSAGPWFAQTGFSRDGADAIQSPVPSGSSPSTLSLPVMGPGVVSFWTLGGGQSASAIALRLNGTFNRYVAGSAGWVQTLLPIPAGAQTVSWQPEVNLWDAIWLDGVVFTPAASVPLADALDGGPPVTPTTATGTWSGQTGISHDGTDAVQSPLPNTGEAKLTTTVTGPAVITYWYRWPSATNYGGDGFNVWVDGNSWERHEPTPDWTPALIVVESGTHTVEWRTVDNKGLLWLDEFTLQAPVPAATFTEVLDQPALTWSTIGAPPWRAIPAAGGVDDFAITPNLTGGEFLTLTAGSVQGPGTLQFKWRRQRNTLDQTYELTNGGDALAACTVHAWENRTLRLPPGNIPLHWNYSVPFGLVQFQEHRAWLDAVSFVPDPAISLTDAFDTTVPLTTSGGTWAGYQSNQAADGSDCVFVSNVPASGSATLSATVTGPGYLSFSAAVGEFFKTSDIIRFDVDGVPRGGATQTSWQYNGVDLPAGTHLLQWVFLRGPTGNSSTCAKLDRLTWQPGTTLSGAANSGAVALSSSGSTAWAPLSLPGASHDLVITSPILAVGGDARLATTLNGAGTLSFSWYREGTASPPQLTLTRNGTQVVALTAAGVWQRTTVILAPGTHSLEWHAAIQSGAPADSGRCFLDDISFIQTGATGYNTWAAGWFTPAQLADVNISGPLADPDRDGQANLNELGFGGNPLVPGDLATGEWITTGGVRAYCFHRLPAFAGIVTLTPQYSTNLSTWSDAVSQVVFNDGKLEYLRAFIPADEHLIFFRVKATLAP